MPHGKDAAKQRCQKTKMPENKDAGRMRTYRSRMITTRRQGPARFAVVTLCVIFCATLTGCSRRTAETTQIRNPWLGSIRIAVAPALNFSGSRDFDADIVADIMASELSHVDGFVVIPVSRALSVLAQQGRDRIQTPAQAIEVMQALGAEAILVFAITEYDPYEPPIVGITAQIYGSAYDPGFTRLDPIQASRAPTPMGGRTVAAPDEPVAQSSQVFNAAHEPVVRALKTFARLRGADDSAFGWEKYLVSQQHYLRFCCQATIKELVQSGFGQDVVTASNQ